MVVGDGDELVAAELGPPVDIAETYGKDCGGKGIGDTELRTYHRDARQPGRGGAANVVSPLVPSRGGIGTAGEIGSFDNTVRVERVSNLAKLAGHENPKDSHEN